MSLQKAVQSRGSVALELLILLGALCAVSACVLPAVGGSFNESPADAAATTTSSDQSATSITSSSSPQTDLAEQAAATASSGAAGPGEVGNGTGGAVGGDESGSALPTSSRPPAAGAGSATAGAGDSRNGGAGVGASRSGAADSPSGPTAGAAGSSRIMPGICSAGTACQGPFNCIDRVCIEPTPSCDHHKAANPDAGDGVYWLRDPLIISAENRTEAWNLVGGSSV